MRKVIGVVLLLVAGFFAARGVGWDWTPQPQPAPTPSVDVPAELATALRSLEIPERDRKVWGGMLAGGGRFVDADGKAKTPLIVTVADLDRLRLAMVAAPIEPVAGGDLVGKTLGPYLDKIGKVNEKLDESGRRAEVVKLFLGAGGVLANGK